MSSHNANDLEALGPLHAVNHAASILMADHEVSKVAALEMLVQRSLTGRVKLHELAQRIVDEHDSKGSGDEGAS